MATFRPEGSVVAMRSGSVAPFGDDGTGSFWTGNIHCHSPASDGRAHPDAVVAAYRAAGHDFVCLTDHFEAEYGWRVTDTTGLATPGFATIVGAELSSGPWDAPDCYWVNAIGLDPAFPPPADGEPPEAVIARARRAGAFMVLLHPGLNNLGLEAALAIEHIDAVETHNTNMSVQWPDAANGRYILDGLLAHGRRVLVVAGDDSHGFHSWDSFGNVLRVRSTELTAASLVASLKAGHYYTTQGPCIDDVRIMGDELRVDTPDVRSIIVTGRNWLDTQSAQGESLDGATFSVAAFRGSYFRVTLLDRNSKRCWTNPIYLDGPDAPRRPRSSRAATLPRQDGPSRLSTSGADAERK